MMMILDHVPANFARALSYLGMNAVTVFDQTAVDIVHHLYQYYGLLVGSSSAMNAVALLQLSSSSKNLVIRMQYHTAYYLCWKG